METNPTPLELRVSNYEARLQVLGLTDKKRFIDITHDPTGRMCVLYQNTRTGKLEYESIENKKY